MSFAERVWWVLTVAAVGWYLTVTIVVAVRGAIDIKHMLNRLDQRHRTNQNDLSSEEAPN